MSTFSKEWVDALNFLKAGNGDFDLQKQYCQLALEFRLTLLMIQDVGIHAIGWSLGEAAEYVSAYDPVMGAECVFNHVFVAEPGFIIRCWMGVLKVETLRKKAQELLGRRFDVNVFQEVVAQWWCLPLQALEKHVDWYIDREKHEGIV